MLRHGDKNLKIPLYSLATILIDQIPETATNLLSFAELVKEDVKNRRIQLQATFLERIPSAVEPAPRAQVATFPFLKLTERIVVVDVPHLYEVDALSERASLCEDINGFIPICPIDPIFLKVEKVRVIREMLEKVDIPPFQRWSKMMADGLAFLHDDRKIVKHSVNLAKLHGVRLEVPLVEAEFEDEAIEEPVVQEEQVTSASPLDMTIIDAEVFLPTMDVVNAAGAEYFEQILQAESDGIP
jgi:hypothetical protein